MRCVFMWGGIVDKRLYLLCCCSLVHDGYANGSDCAVHPGKDIRDMPDGPCRSHTPPTPKAC